MKIGNYFRELTDFSRFFDSANASARRVVFYSERDIYYQYFEGLIGELLRDPSFEFSYITSDPSDPVFTRERKGMNTFFIDKLLPGLLKKLDAEALIMTMPDLNRFHIKRAPGVRNHIYMFHAMVSTHLQYRKGAFDDYDTIFCVGPHHVREIRRTEELYGLKPKTLVETGYYRLEKIYRDHQEYRKAHPHTDGRTILVAPTWGESSVLELCPDELITALGALRDWRCVIRPHPEFLKRKPGEAAKIAKAVSRFEHLSFETDMVSDVSIHSADVLITDRSGIAFEYAFGTERPVLFIDTPLKVNNPDYLQVGIEPVEIWTRRTVGVTLQMSKLNALSSALLHQQLGAESHRKALIELRNQLLFHWLEASTSERTHLIDILT